MSEIQSFVESIFDELVAIRRDIHAHPEVGMTEVRTSALIRSELEKMGVDEIQQPLPTAVVGLIHGTKGPGKCVALRADIDALPVHEETGLPFSSVNEGVMHACGHDLHTTMLLGAAKTLCHMRDQFAGTVKLIFEPSEDTMPGGARKLVAAGVMESPHVDAIFGQHVCPSENDTIGRMQLYKGYFTSAVDLFHIKVHGKSGHGSAPHTARDAIACAGYLITVLQTVVARRIDPMDTAVLTPVRNTQDCERRFARRGLRAPCLDDARPHGGDSRRDARLGRARGAPCQSDRTPPRLGPQSRGRRKARPGARVSVRTLEKLPERFPIRPIFSRHPPVKRRAFPNACRSPRLGRSTMKERPADRARPRASSCRKDEPPTGSSFSIRHHTRGDPSCSSLILRP